MGCDIHSMIEVKTRYGWMNAGDPNRKLYRNYRLFSILADVRNDSENLKPISLPRGLPSDSCKEFELLYKYWKEDAHSTSWLTLKEMKDYKEDEDNHLLWLIEAMEKVKDSSDMSDEDVRLVFFFDN